MTIVLLWVWGVTERTGHDKPKEKGPVRPESISRHREWRPEHLQYCKDETVFSQSSSADAVFYIQKGKVKITVVSRAG